MNSLLKLRRFPLNKLINSSAVRSVSTSTKKNDTAVLSQSTTAETGAKSKNWVSYGFDRLNQQEDRFWTHLSFFSTITLCMTIGGLFYIYMPDYTFKNWAQREAFLELRRREKLGLPLIDPNLIDPEKIQLPSDEELGDTEIII